MAITLRDVIEVYEEKLRELRDELEDEKESSGLASKDYQSGLHDRNSVLGRIKLCRGRKCRALASEYEDDYPYQRRQR